MKTKGIKKGAILLLACILFISPVFAADVAYITSSRYTKLEIMSVFSEMNLSVEVIQDSLIFTKDLSKYKLLFIDDAYLRNTASLQIYKYPSIIMNKFYGPQWGLTDADGISQLASTSPLEVDLVGNGAKQVYTIARDNRYVSIPYYYLSDENKANFTSVARAFKIYANNQLGDVISYAPKGIRLIDGKYSGAKLCFYGIAKTNYWTADARKLFKDCAGFVLTTCSKDSECDDQNIRTKDTCVNPGAADSYCNHENIPCFNDLECGTNGFTGSSYCSGLDILRNYRSFNCINPGSVTSYCTNSTTANKTNTCLFGCVSGSCIACSTDANCNDNNSTTQDICLNPGLLNSTCTHTPITCSYDSDCGTNGFTGSNYCSGKNVTRDYLSFTCHNGGLGTSYCSNATTHILNQTCSDICDLGICKTILCYNNSDCNDGNLWTEDICLLPGTYDSSCTHNPIKCFQNSDCGIDFMSGLTCSENNVIKNVLNWTCYNKGASSSYCANSTSILPQETCLKGCVNGACINCAQDSDCDDNSPRTLDRCVNPNTTASYCRNTEVNCLNDLDCGETGFIPTDFCFQNDVFKNYRNATCMNSGTLDSNCVITIGPKLTNNCSDNNPETIDLCLEPPARCEHRLVECFNDSDCGNTEIKNNYCSGNSVMSNYSIPACLNNGTSNSSCSFNYLQLLNQTCSHGCSQGECVNIHNVGFIDLTNSVNKIQLTYSNNTYILEAIPNLNCHDVIKTKVRVFNFGDFSEDVSLTGSFGSSAISMNSISGLVPGDYSERSSLSPYLNLSGLSGLINITINAGISGDINLSDNTALRQIFVSCPVCFVNSDCDDNNLSTEDICLNPGLLNSSCTHKQIRCFQNSDCGTNGAIGEEFCSGNNITQNYITFTCHNPGESTSSCENSTSPQSLQVCQDYCLLGECKEFTCEQNSDCGEDGWINGLTCNEDDVFQNYRNFTCLNPSSQSSQCVNSTVLKFKQECGESSCGSWGENYCFNNSVYHSRSCNDLGCNLGICFNNSRLEQEQVQICQQGTSCDDGECVPTCTNQCNLGEKKCSGNNVQTCADYNLDGCTEWNADAYCQNGCEDGACIIRCDENSDCGISDWIFFPNCQENDVFQIFRNWSCLNPGTPQSICNLSDIILKKQECGTSGCGDWGDNYCFNDSVYHSRSCNDLGCNLGICFNNSRLEQEQVQICQQGTSCDDGICKNITCYNDEDCGLPDWIGDKFCSGKDIYQDFLTPECKNPGTISSYCENKTEEKFVNSCDYKCTDGSCEEQKQCISVKAIGSQNGKGITVACPSNYTITGGGYSDKSTNNDDQDDNYPIKSLNAWHCRDDNSNIKSECYAVCCPSEFFNISVANKTGNQKLGLSISCGSNILLGGGFGGEWENDYDQDVSMPLDNSWYCREDHSVNKAACFGVCAQATGLQCTNVEATGNVASGLIASCSSLGNGYFMVGGGFDKTKNTLNYGNGQEMKSSSPVDNGWYCLQRKEAAGYEKCYARCCKFN